MRRRFPLLASAVALASASTASLAQTEPVELGEIVVTAAGFEQNISDAPASISVISGEELAKKSYKSIVDAVNNIPGVYVTGGGGAQDISIRGMHDSYTLYLVDGRPVSAGRSVNTNGQDGGKQIALPPISMIERVEVIRGPMSSLYGSEAMGGVIGKQAALVIVTLFGLCGVGLEGRINAFLSFFPKGFVGNTCNIEFKLQLLGL